MLLKSALTMITYPSKVTVNDVLAVEILQTKGRLMKLEGIHCVSSEVRLTVPLPILQLLLRKLAQQKILQPSASRGDAVYSHSLPMVGPYKGCEGILPH